MLHVALWEPEIAPNTGNIARLCAATGAALHLIGRLGFRLDDRSLKRAGLDYWHAVELHRHATLVDFEEALAGARVLCFSAHAERAFTQVAYQAGDCLLFGGESHGLPEGVL
jgi:tRNA (cytidine/uridine-2'-O-)-methyltransferase